ncbi:tetratricopeptide repeat protein [Oceanobacillus senegalensis]|uniref:tetratricopeptide repeat protein n=1 Tax=Oceanobacillus senegalensis TaxID=1936063 RepID=UPI000A30E458|nr:tetratricopeptide repeat protein [Oceanobacillus senegalensis]
MQTHHEKVILFPKWKKSLEEESLIALKEKQYEKALVKLNKLLMHHVDSYEIITGKLICLMELGRFNEAQDLCEDLLKSRDENYYHYLHIYLTILFQTNQYELLMEQVEEILLDKEIPKPQKDQFIQLYEISEKMQLDVITERKKQVFDELFQAVKEKKFEEQWRQVDSLRSLKTDPTEEIIELLVHENVHPLTKSAIVLWLKEKEVSQQVEISKFGICFSFNPITIEGLEQSEFIIETKKLLRPIEEKNPTLYYLLAKLLSNYAYVIYPILPQKEDYLHIAKALEIIGDEYFNLGTTQEDLSDKVENYIENIKMSESLYLSIME